MDHKSKSNRLDNYLRSHCTVAPKDLAAYQSKGGDKRALCPFCDCVHNHHPILLWDFTGKVEDYTITDAFSCDSCNLAIQRTLNTETEAEQVHQAAVRKNRYKNVGLFVRDGIFPRNAYLHRTHIRQEDFLHQSHRYTQCVFCDASLTANASQLSKRALMLPVGIDIYSVDGGTVYACGDCMNVIHQTIPELSLDGWLANTFATSECVRCSNTYAMTMEEEEMRSILKTHGQYLCGACACDNLRENGVGPLHILKQGLNGMSNRYVEIHCEFCLEEFSMDQMFSPVYAFNTHVTENGRIVCRECCYKDKPPFLATRSGDLLWSFYESDGEFTAAHRRVGGTFRWTKSLGSISEVLAFFKNLENDLLWQ